MDDDRVDVAPGVPTDRVRWGPILAGTFVALTTLAVLSTLGAAIGLSSYDRGHDDVRNFAMASGAWGVISTILAFALGGWTTARASAVRGRHNAMLNGALVAAVGIPLILYMLGSAAAAAANAAATADAAHQQQARSQYDGAVAASARMGDTTNTANTPSNNNGTNTADDDAERARRAGSRTAWGTLAGMVLAIAAAAAAGFVGARDDDRNDHRRVNVAATTGDRRV